MLVRMSTAFPNDSSPTPIPTRGLKSLLANVCARLSGTGTEVAAIFRLDTSFGGGKTHGLDRAGPCCRRHAWGRERRRVHRSSVCCRKGQVRIAAFDGENADPANGRAMGEGVLAFTPWGEIAYALAGNVGLRAGAAAATSRRWRRARRRLRELFGGEPTLILLDELSVYLRKVQNLPHARDQLTAFLTSLFKAVEAAPNAALVYTLAIGKDGRATDAYSDENQFIADRMAEAGERVGAQGDAAQSDRGRRDRRRCCAVGCSSGSTMPARPR